MCDLMPPSFHEILQDVESYVALPVLVIIGLCILQFVFCQMFQIICTISEIMKRKEKCRPKRKPKCPPGPSLMERLKGMFCTRPEKCGSKKPRASKRILLDEISEKKFDDWDDNVEYDDDDEIMDEN